MVVFCICSIIFISLIKGSFGTPFLENQLYTSKVLELLEHEDSNKILINTVVKCISSPEDDAMRSTDFIRCMNDTLHTDELTNIDSVGFILGNYIIQSSLLLYRCYEENNDFLMCLRTFGDCLPLLLRNLFGFPEYSFKCRKLINIPSYDVDGTYLDEQDDEVTFSKQNP